MADKGSVLVSGLSVPLELDYVDRGRYRKVQSVFLRSMSYRLTEGTEAPRVDLHCTSLAEHKPKTFFSQKIISITDQRTGEVFSDPTDCLKGIIADAGGTQPPEWPEEIIRVRCQLPEIDENGFLVGWKFGVHKAFLSALDIAWESVQLKNRNRETVLTEGIPRVYSFCTGDMLYSPPTKPEKWEKQVLKLQRGVQVASASSDRIINRKKIDGLVEADLWDFVAGKMTNKRRVTMTQDEFVHLLQTGFLPCAPTNSSPDNHEKPEPSQLALFG